jgi:hypothetical protein
VLRCLCGPAIASLALALANVAIAGSPVVGESRIEVDDDGWGAGEPVEIGRILSAVAEEFRAPAAEHARPPIRVRHRFGGPLIDYDRDRDGWIVIRLSARDARWYQYVYQFAHEYCHLLAHFDRKQRDDEIVREHQWFEESLCETASLYALRRLAVKWRDSTDPQLREAAAQLSQYFEQLLAEPHRGLDPGTDLAAWYFRNQETLRGKPYLRELNELAATRLLPLFESDASRWAALAYLNPIDPSPGQSFSDFLQAWSAASPPALRPLVAEIRALFGLQPISAPSDGGPVRTLQTPAPDKKSGCGS